MNNRVTEDEVRENMKDVIVRSVEEFDKKVTYVTVRMKNGFTLRESTTCVDPSNYDEEIGKKICLDKIEDKVWFLLGYELQDRVSRRADALRSTEEMMESCNYKDRFKAEYIQVSERMRKLCNMLERWENGGLDFTPDCPKELLEKQVEAMEAYQQILLQRAEYELIDLK